MSLRARLLRYAGPALLSASAWFGLMPSLSSAGEYIEPAPFSAASTARPLSATSTATTPLRWKAKHTASQNEAEIDPFGGPAAYEQQPQTAQLAPAWNTTRIDGSVRPVQYTASDAASDPFGDRGSAHRGGSPTLMLQAAAQDSAPPPSRFEPYTPPSATLPDNTLPDNTLPDNTLPENSLPENTIPEPNDAPAPMPMPRSFAPPPSTERYSPAPFTEPTYPDSGRAPCNQIYNDRDCCEVIKNIQAFRMQLRNDTIRKISLDISPPFLTDVSQGDSSEERADKLRLSGIRQWHNQRGELIATGQLSNLLYGDAIITDESGKTVARIPLNSLADDDLCFMTAWWRLPFEGIASYEEFAGRDWIPSTFYWHASALCHKPLYFEEVQAERYGHVTGPFTQPVISGAHFFLNIAALPYNMAISPPMECEYALGYYRPGSCAPWMIPPIPLSLRGAAAQTGVILGGVYLIP